VVWVAATSEQIANDCGHSTLIPTEALDSGLHGMVWNN
jgi:hypothetical protein